MAHYSSPSAHGAEGSIAKIIGVIFILIGAYTLLTFYKIISFAIPASPEQILLACAIGSVIGGLYMLVRGGSQHRY